MISSLTTVEVGPSGPVGGYFSDCFFGDELKNKH